MVMPMRSPRPPSPPHSRLSWLFWLAMLLPMAQGAATWHGYSHVVLNASAQTGDKQAPHPEHCELCLAAAALGSGALPSVALSLADRPAGHELPPHVVRSVGLARAALAYRSRAPPSTLH
jgi:hypothetical protein